MKRNPLLKAEERIISKVYGNLAEMLYRVRTKSYNAETGEIFEVNAEFVRGFHYTDPHIISETSADGKNYIVGDVTFSVAFAEFQKNLELSLPTDPAGLSLKTLRGDAIPYGINAESDAVRLFGRKWRVVKITPLEVYANIPALLKLQLREGAV